MPSTRRFHFRDTGALAISLVIGTVLSLSFSSPARAELANVDGTLPLDLVTGSRLLAVEHYSDGIHEVTNGPSNMSSLLGYSVEIENNPGATFDPDTQSIYFLTGMFSGCTLHKFLPGTNTRTTVAPITDLGAPVTWCWGLTSLGDNTALIGVNSILYDVNLTTGAISSPRSLPFMGSGLAIDPATGNLYVGRANGEIYRADVTRTTATLTLITSVADTTDGSGQNLKGFAIDTDSTLFYISTWVPKLFSLDLNDLTAPVKDYGYFRPDPTGPIYGMDALAMIYTPLPTPEPGDPDATESLAATGAGLDFPIGLATGAFGIVVASLGFAFRPRRRS